VKYLITSDNFNYHSTYLREFLCPTLKIFIGEKMHRKNPAHKKENTDFKLHR